MKLYEMKPRKKLDNFVINKNNPVFGDVPLFPTLFSQNRERKKVHLVHLMRQYNIEKGTLVSGAQLPELLNRIFYC
jgi:hypothetical protein